MDIMALLDTAGMNKLRMDFENHPEGLSLHEFIGFAMTRLPDSVGLSDVELVAKLIDLFEQVDVNGDGVMEWEEFSEFCIELGMATTTNTRLELMEKYVERDYVDTTTHSPCIRRIKYIPELSKLFVCEFGCRSLKVYDPHHNNENKMVLLHELNTVWALNDQEEGDGGAVLDVEYLSLDGRNILVLSSTNLTLTFWDASTYDLADDNPPRFLLRVPTTKPQMLMCWCSSASSLLTAGTAPIITVWHIRTIPKFAVSKAQTLNNHADMIQDMLFIKDLDLVCSASLDTCIHLWTTDGQSSGENAIVWKGQRCGHRKGVRSLAYVQDGVILSAAFDLTILAWDVSGQSIRPLLELNGHQNPLLAVHVLPSKQHALSVDAGGVMKTWDIRRENGISDSERCLQTFTSEAPALARTSSSTCGEARHGQNSGALMAKEFHPHCAALTYPNGSVVAGGTKLHIWDRIELAPQRHAPVACLYNPTNLTIACAINRDVKLWDARTGELLTHFQAITPSEITSLCLDFRERKFIVSDQSGTIVVCNYMNGSKMKQNPAHLRRKEVSRVIYGNEDKVLIVAAWDRCVRIYDEMQRGDNLGVLRTMEHAHSSDINSLAFSHRLGLFATGADDCTLRIWDFEFLAWEGECRLPASISTMCFVDPFPLLLVADQNGDLSMWPVRPCQSGSSTGLGSNQGIRISRNECVGKFRCCDSNAVATCIQLVRQDVSKVRVSSMGLPRESLNANANRRSRFRYLLYAGDECGRVFVFDLTSAILVQLGMAPAPRNSLPVARENYNARRKLWRTFEDQGGNNKSESSCHTLRNYSEQDFASLLTLDIQVLRSWKAHDGPIQSIQVTKNPDTVLTCSQDKTIRIWSLQGRDIGCLDANESKGIHVAHREITWSFPIDMSERKRVALEKGSRVLDALLVKNHTELAAEGLELPPISDSLPNLVQQHQTHDLTSSSGQESELEEQASFETANEDKAEEFFEQPLETKSDVLKCDGDHHNCESGEERSNEDSCSESEDDGLNGETFPNPAPENFVKATYLTRILKQGEKFRQEKRRKMKEAIEARKAERRAFRENKMQSRRLLGNEEQGVSVLDSVATAQTGIKGIESDRQRVIGQLMGQVTWIKTQQELAQDKVHAQQRKILARNQLKSTEAIDSLGKPMKKAKRPRRKKNRQNRETKKPTNKNKNKKNRAPPPLQRVQARDSADERTACGTQIYKNLCEELRRTKAQEYQQRRVKSRLSGVFDLTPSSLLSSELNSVEKRNSHGFPSRKSMTTSASEPALENATSFPQFGDKTGVENNPLKLANGEEKHGKIKDAEEKDELDLFTETFIGKLASKSAAEARERLDQPRFEEQQSELSSRGREKSVRVETGWEIVQHRRKQSLLALNTVTQPTNADMKRLRTCKYFGPYPRAEVIHVRSLFRSLDYDNDGSVDIEEFKKQIEKTSASSGNFRALLDQSISMFQAVDEDGSGSLGIDELARVLFKQATSKEFQDILMFLRLPRETGQDSIRNADGKDAENGSPEDAKPWKGLEEAETIRDYRVEIRHLFDLYDGNGDGMLTLEELEEAIVTRRNNAMARNTVEGYTEGGLTTADLDDLIRKYDSDKNKMIDFEEFYDIFRDIWD